MIEIPKQKFQLLKIIENVYEYMYYDLLVFQQRILWKLIVG